MVFPRLKARSNSHKTLSSFIIHIFSKDALIGPFPGTFMKYNPPFQLLCQQENILLGIEFSAKGRKIYVHILT